MKSVHSLVTVASFLFGLAPVSALVRRVDGFNATDSFPLIAKNGTYVTEVVYATTTVCPAGQTITDKGKLYVLPTPWTSTYKTTVTKTVCPKCTGKPANGMNGGSSGSMNGDDEAWVKSTSDDGMSGGVGNSGNGQWSAGSDSGSGSDAGRVASSGSSSDRAAMYEEWAKAAGAYYAASSGSGSTGGAGSAGGFVNNAVSKIANTDGMSTSSNPNLPWSGMQPKIHDLISGPGGFPMGMNLAGDKLPGKNAPAGAAEPNAADNLAVQNKMVAAAVVSSSTTSSLAGRPAVATTSSTKTSTTSGRAAVVTSSTTSGTKSSTTSSTRSSSTTTLTSSTTSIRSSSTTSSTTSIASNTSTRSSSTSVTSSIAGTFTSVTSTITSASSTRSSTSSSVSSVSSSVSSSTSTSSSSSTSSSLSSSTTSSRSSTTSSSTSSSITSSVSSPTSSTRSSSTVSSSTSGACTAPLATNTATCGYWMENVKHQGIAAFNANPGTYTVYRNVKDFGAKGDGVTDDTAAINAAISSGGRCAPGKCGSSTTTPAVVYFPAGTYIVSTPIINYYYTQIIGNPNCMPVIKATANFNGAWILDNNQYQAGGVLGFGSTNVFWRQVRNLIIDITSVAAGTQLRCVHTPTAQATSLQNMVFRMSSAAGTQHEGIFIESGSGGFMTDLVFFGGLNGATFGNQQFTMRNLTFNNAVTAINQLWDWGWTYKGVTINNCQVGIDMSGIDANTKAQSVGGIVLIDSDINNTPIGVLTNRNSTSLPASGGNLILENVRTNNVPAIVKHKLQNQVFLAGNTGRVTVTGWAQGHVYDKSATQITIQDFIVPLTRPASLVAGSDYYERSKPQYEQYSAASFISARTAGAKGDGVTDDTVALQAAINAAAGCSILFIDAGTYKVTKTLVIPPGSKIVGESYSVIMSSGAFFNNINNPQPVLQVGSRAGQVGSAELSDLIVSTQGMQAGAILIEWNIAASSQGAAGMWDVHTRIGGFAGSNLQLANCPVNAGTQYNAGNVNQNCVAAFMSMHITSVASGAYLENCWFWVADHDVEDPALTQITVYAGRGLLVDSAAGGNWFVGTSVEHHSLYEYQFANTKDVFAGQIQTETAYYQPNPVATIPFPPNAAYNDPTFQGFTTVSGWGFRALNCGGNINIYGAGHYSFFSNNDVTCSNNQANACQTEIVSIENSSNAVGFYNLNTVGTQNMVTVNAVDRAPASANVGVFIDSVAIVRV